MNDAMTDFASLIAGEDARAPFQKHKTRSLQSARPRTKVGVMANELDASEFIDDDFQAAHKSPSAVTGNPFATVPSDAQRAPTREEVDSKVGETHQKLAELKRVQQELERERAALEETRRRQSEFTTGRQEMVQNLTRGLGLLEEAEFASRRDAEQMAKTVVELREAQTKIQTIHEEAWTKDNLNVELTR